MKTTLAAYCLAMGVFMVAWWGINIRGGALRRPDRSRAEIVLHVTAELLTAALLIVGGAILLMDGTLLVAVSGLGMLLYTVVASPGYFLARRELAPVIMFGALTVLTLAALVAAWATEA